jgi:NCS1 family nucleobase:cation symporter-1
MATVTERLERVLEREAPVWGIRRVPPEHRRLTGLDFGVLWGDLAIGLLVMLTGTFLVLPPDLGGFGLGLPRALLAVAVGSLLGCLPLALVGLAGAREGVPGMVLFRPVLGLRGSYLPSVLNIAQLVGWTGFEFWVMALVATQMSRRLFDVGSYWFWLAVVAVVCTALALGGPILVVRRWLERFGVWVLAGAAGWITVAALTRADLGALWSRPGQGGVPFWLAVDLVIVMPVSWLPLVADYNRFARGPWSSAAGSYVGYAVGNVWLYALGAFVALGAGLSVPAPGPLGEAVAGVAGGAVVLLALLVGETDEAFADIYSAAVSTQNIAERVPQRGAVVAVAAAGAALAAWLGVEGEATLVYESFLFLLGSVFVPLFGVFVADYFLLRRREGGGSRRSWRASLPAFVAWAAGFLVYHWSAPVGPSAWVRGVRAFFEGLGLPFPLWSSVAGASAPAFGAALLVHLLLGTLGGGRGPDPGSASRGPTGR